MCLGWSGALLFQTLSKGDAWIFFNERSCPLPSGEKLRKSKNMVGCIKIIFSINQSKKLYDMIKT